MITVEPNVNTIELSIDSKEIIIETTQNIIELSHIGSKGPKGDAGAGLPLGGTTGQIITKVDGTDYNTVWSDPTVVTLAWNDYALNVEYTGVDTVIASGDVSECDYDGGLVYRFIDSTDNANGYPIEDSFYDDFNGVTLTNLLATRGIL